MSKSQFFAVRPRLFFAACVSAALTVSGVYFSGLPQATATQAATDAVPLFYKFDKYYLNLEKVTHVIDEPGYNMPPGSLQVYFDGNQNWIALFGEDAEAFRKAIAQVTTDLTPKKKAEAAEKSGTTKPAAPGAKKRAISPGAAAPAGAATPKSPAPLTNNDSGI